MGQWGVVAKSPATGIGYSYYPTIWEDSGKIYCKAQGEYDINVYDIVTDTWSLLLNTASSDSGYLGNNNIQYAMFRSAASRADLMWTYGNFIYVLGPQIVDTSNTGRMCLIKYNITTKIKVSSTLHANLSTNMTISNSSYVKGDWAHNRHKAVVKDTESGRIFLINFYLKQIYEFITASDTFTLVKTWTETFGSRSTDDAAGCDAVCLNGKIYLLGKHSYNDTGGGTSGPVEITIADWTTVTKTIYPDYGSLSPYTYKFYSDTIWFTIGNNIYGYGGRMCSATVADFSGTNAASGNILRKIMFNPSTNIWTDLGIIGSSLLYAPSISYSGKSYIIAGYEAGSVSQSTRSFEYILEAPSSFTSTYNPILQRVELSWVDNSAEESYYIITRKRDDENVYTQIANLPADTLTYNDTDIDISSHFYSYKVWCEKVL
jgi:hypothetical protein